MNVYKDELNFPAKERSCGNPGTPDHGAKEGNGYQYGQSVKFTCTTGYQLQGSATRTCQTNGQWTGTQPTCNSKQRSQSFLVL